MLHYLLTKEEKEDIYHHEWINTTEQMLIGMKQGSNFRIIGEGRGLEFENPFGQTIRYETYQQVLRKRVDYKGHVIVLQNVKDVSFSLADGQVKMSVTGLNQTKYEAFFPVLQLLGR